MDLYLSVVIAVFKVEKHPYNARFDDGKLFYEGDWYNKGHHIIIDNREDSPVQWVPFQLIVFPL